jgi:lipopolysaccharide transport system permease protein
VRTALADRSEWVNEPTVPGPAATLGEVWRYRRFLKYLGFRAMRKLYARTALGWSWILIRPLFPLTIRVLVFGGLLGMTSEGIPYFLFLTIGTVPWDFFSSAVMWSTRGLEMNRKVLTRVYVPKVILPMATTMPSLFDLGVNVCVLILAVAYFRIADGTTYLSLGVHTIWSVIALVLLMLLALGIGFVTSIWGETARDARFTMAQVITVWFLLTPILYPASALTPQQQRWLVLNPVASYVEAFKYGLFGTQPPDPYRFGSALALTAIVFGFCLWFFLRQTDEEAED